MTTLPKLDADAVYSDARRQVLVVMQHLGVKGTERGEHFRTRLCWRCGERSRDAVAINLASGLGSCFVCGAGGNLFEIVAGYSGYDAKRDFPKVLEMVAVMVGHLPPNDPAEADRQRQLRKEEEARRQVEREADEKARREEAKFRAASEWKRLVRNGANSAGVSYLRKRGLDGKYLFENGFVRFTAAGDPCVPLWDFDGELVNVVRRIINPKDDGPKILGLKECPTAGALVGRLQDIQSGDVMLVEGVADALTAACIWRDRVVLGAHGAGRMPLIAGFAAKRITKGRLVLVPDNDDTGQGWALKAGTQATTHGLVIDQTLVVLDVSPHHDLNDAHCAGWKP